MKKVSTTSHSMSLLEWLTLAFVVLKLLHVIDWSWWLVLMPFWAFLASLLILAVLTEIWS